MKKHSTKTLLVVVLLASSIISCKKNLVLIPNAQVTSEQVYSTAAGYKQSLAKVYGSMALTGNQGPAGDGDIQGIDEGTSDFFRLFWYAEELPTDEAVIAWGDPGVPDMHAMNWSSSNVNLTGLYYRSLYQITLDNEFLIQSTDAELSKRGIAAADITNIHYYRAEVRFLRAYQYWVLMDLFGKPPFVTDANPVGSIVPPQTTRAALFTYVEGELKEIEPLLVAPMKNEYGRVDQGAADALLARLYLNAQVYTGTAHWTDAITYASKVIADGYSLIPNYQNLFLADNNKNIAENIFSINYDGNNTQGYGGTTFMTHASVGGSMNSTLYGIAGGWDGIRATKNLLNLFPANTNTNSFPANGNPDSRAEFWVNGQSIDINDVTKFTDGVAVNKWRNVTTGGAQGSNPGFSDIDEPLFRLPEMYLIYAEAVLNSGTGGSMTTAVDYINKIRTRAGATPVTSIDLPFILDERGRELYWEGFRRTDLIRFGKFTGGSYLWPFKGGVKGGTSVPDYLSLYPIPDQDRAANPNLTQNPGY